MQADRCAGRFDHPITRSKDLFLDLRVVAPVDNNASTNAYRQVLALVSLRDFLISAHQIPVSMQI